MSYVYDEFGDGYASISETLPEEYETFIGEYSSKVEADIAASNYEDYIQNEIDKTVENWYYDDDDFYDDDEE